MRNRAAAVLGFIAAIGAALVVTSLDGGDSYTIAEEDSMKTYGVTDAELAKLVKSYEHRIKRSARLDADTRAGSYVFVAVANAQAAGVQRMLRGVMCPENSADPAEKQACDARFSAATAGRVCNAQGDKVGYTVGFPATPSQLGVLSKWKDEFTLARYTTSTFENKRYAVHTFLDSLADINVYRCPLGELTP